MQTRSADGSRELDLKEFEEKIEKFRGQLRTTKTNKEYSAMQHEIATFEADKSVIEDEILERMTTLDEIEKEHASLQEEVKRAEAEHQKEIRRVEAEVAKLRKELEQIEARRPPAAERVGPELLLEYERILARRGASAMAAVVDGSCQGCFMRLTLQRLADLRKGAAIITCNSCGRILYLAEEADEKTEQITQ